MAKFKELYNEARRNKETNPRQGAVAQLKQYKEQNDVYISYTTIDKLGLNPKSGFDTPIGIYSYPILETWHDLVYDAMPYRGESPYITAFRYNGYKDFIEDISKLSMDDATNYWDMVTSYAISKYSPQIKRLNAEQHTSIDSGDALAEFIQKKITDNVVPRPRDRSAGGQLWYLTKVLANTIAMYHMGSKSHVIWTTLLLNGANLSGIADKSDAGIIHPNETTQAVFFTIKAVDVLKRVHNKSYSETLKFTDFKKLTSGDAKKIFRKVLYAIKHNRKIEVGYNDAVDAVWSMGIKNAVTIMEYIYSDEELVKKYNHVALAMMDAALFNADTYVGELQQFGLTDRFVALVRNMVHSPYTDQFSVKKMGKTIEEIQELVDIMPEDVIDEFTKIGVHNPEYKRQNIQDIKDLEAEQI